MITDNYILMHFFTYLSNYFLCPNLSTEGRVGGCASSYVDTSLAARRLSAPSGTRPEVRETITSVSYRVSACSVSGYDGLVGFFKKII